MVSRFSSVDRPEHSGNLPALAMCLAKRIQESDHLTRGDMLKTEPLAGSFFSPIDGGKFRAAILSTFRRLGFEKPHQHEGAKRHHGDNA
jgi:hypothetical protein